MVGTTAIRFQLGGERVSTRTKTKAGIARLVASRDIDDDAEERQRVGVQSLGRAFGILEEVARHREGINLADLSKRVGLHNSTTFHLVKTMVSLGYIRQEKDKRYRVGRPLFALAASSLDEIEMVNLATPILEDLSRETGESGHFAVRMGDSVIVVARTSGPGAFQLTDRVGVVRPAHCTALGKIILAALRPDQLQRFVERVELKPSTPRPRSRSPRSRCCCARSRRCAAAASRSTTASSMRKCVASRCRCAISPAMWWARSAFPARSGG
jgi:DNA-binding IclR family transcriptional regulator